VHKTIAVQYGNMLANIENQRTASIGGNGTVFKILKQAATNLVWFPTE
jgi:hypothetical protein